jgi:hypothetical protein
VENGIGAKKYPKDKLQFNDLIIKKITHNYFLNDKTYNKFIYTSKLKYNSYAFKYLCPHFLGLSTSCNQ